MNPHYTSSTLGKNSSDAVGASAAEKKRRRLALMHRCG